MKYASQYSDSIYAFTVGSEGLYRREQKAGTGYTATEVLDKIGQLKSALTDAKMTQKVGTADSWNKYQDGTADPLIRGGVDLMYVQAALHEFELNADRQKAHQRIRLLAIAGH